MCEPRGGGAAASKLAGPSVVGVKRAQREQVGKQSWVTGRTGAGAQWVCVPVRGIRGGNWGHSNGAGVHSSTVRQVNEKR